MGHHAQKSLYNQSTLVEKADWLNKVGAWLPQDIEPETRTGRHRLQAKQLRHAAVKHAAASDDLADAKSEPGHATAKHSTEPASELSDATSSLAAVSHAAASDVSAGDAASHAAASDVPAGDLARHAAASDPEHSDAAVTASELNSLARANDAAAGTGYHFLPESISSQSRKYAQSADSGQINELRQHVCPWCAAIISEHYVAAATASCSQLQPIALRLDSGRTASTAVQLFVRHEYTPEQCWQRRRHIDYSD